MATLTSESVSEGHPDKMADQLSDAILDAILEKDCHARVACETLVKSGMVLLTGEITTTSWVDVERIARKTILDIGYNDTSYGFEGESCAILTAIGNQSLDIAKGIGTQAHANLGAGDQGLMFGYATNETEQLMPAPITYAHALVKQQATLRKQGRLSWLRPDAKSQLTFAYVDGVPEEITAVVFSTQHNPEIDRDTLIEAVMEEIIKPTLPARWLTKKTQYYINPAGRFVIGGPVGDSGLTGRKIIVDTYGGAARHGGGCFSGKDPSKVDRSGAYMARYIAKNIVAAGLCQRCELQLSYAIGVSQPTSVDIETFGTNKIAKSEILKLIQQYFPLTPHGIIDCLDLLKPIYRNTAVYGHFGREAVGFTWEKTDKAAELQQAMLL